MTRTTPPRPVDIEAVFPALVAHRRTATRLHPRQGVAKAEESSLAGPLLWPADEPWPVCTAVHTKGTGHRLDDMRLKRSILAEARGRDFSGEERRILDAINPGQHAPDLRDEDPLPLLAVAQLYTRDIPDLVGPQGHDLLQVFWCPFEVHGPDRAIDVVLKWRRSHEVGDVLADQPEPPVAGREECVPTPCVLHPEQVVEHEYLGLLSEGLQEGIDAWEESLLDEEENDEDVYDSSAPQSYDTYEEYEAAMARARAEEAYEVDYMGDLSIAPGWKVGGFASWHLTDHAPVDCAVCGTPLPPLLTVDSGECDGGSRSWLPLEDRDSTDDRNVIDPVGVYLGRGLMRIHTCAVDPTHPHRLSFQ
ncbi:hypothetical protein ACFV9D_27550 [Streptomyces sp. NPDC059875]|uniref:hypothetical protein n=1 Tax=unclassified Streptomyces TaxID=2593676 RepID=UPI003651F0CF